MGQSWAGIEYGIRVRVRWKNRFVFVLVWFLGLRRYVFSIYLCSNFFDGGHDTIRYSVLERMYTQYAISLGDINTI